MFTPERTEDRSQLGLKLYIMFTLFLTLAPEVHLEEIKVWLSVLMGIILVLGIVTIFVAVLRKRVTRP